MRLYNFILSQLLTISIIYFTITITYNYKYLLIYTFIFLHYYLYNNIDYNSSRSALSFSRQHKVRQLLSYSTIAITLSNEKSNDSIGMFLG